MSFIKPPELLKQFYKNSYLAFHEQQDQIQVYHVDYSMYLELQQRYREIEYTFNVRDE